ncbi:MAG: hypothetical protein FJY46_13860 [Betaproteobacteria bacterium]|nr:hypothetical protein [Betaproteobacteria bacterium]
MKLFWSMLIYLPVTAVAQNIETGCITAGRLDSGGRWAPQLSSVRLLDNEGKQILVKIKSELNRVRAAALDEATPFSRCEGEKFLKRGDNSPLSEAQVTAIRPGTVTVVGVGFPKLRVGGELVELQVQVGSKEILMVTP